MILFIDTHFNDVILVLAKDNSILKKIVIQNEKQNSKIIMPNIKNILDNETPESIIVVNGPGSFTGVRLGVTISKTLAYTMQIPIRTITSLECLAISCDGLEKIIAFSDNNGYYIGRFDDKCNLVDNYKYLNKTEFHNYSQKYNVLQDIEMDYIKIITYALTKESINPHEVNPIYIKKIDVEK